MQNFNSLISIIILNYNSGDLLTKSVNSILQSNYKKFEIIVVDNKSTDYSHIRCKDKFPEIILIENKKNLGYGKGNNVGIKNSHGDFIVILNPDTEVSSAWINGLISAYQKYGPALYQPKILSLHDKKIINSTGNMIQLFGIGYSRGNGEIDSGQYDNKLEINNPSGACIFTSKEIMLKIGLFDNFIFAYHDDQYLGWRASQLGIKSYYVPSSVIYHVGSQSFGWSPLKYYLLEKNRHYVLLTMYSRSTLFKMIPALFLVNIAIFFFYFSKGMIKSKIKADFSIFKNLGIISKRYNEIQKNRILNDKQIIKNFVDQVFVSKEVTNNSMNSNFNLTLKVLSSICRKLI